jgi:organic hydroperoxide reductase OsmC/OhrA
MSEERIAAALERLESVLRARPSFGDHEEIPAMAHWQAGLKLSVSHPKNDLKLLTDLPAEVGGNGEGVTPGWLMRAGLAACAASSILLCAAAEGIELESLELTAGSRSDVRGLLGMSDEHGAPVSAAYSVIRLQVRISAPGVARERLQALIERANRQSPVSSALQQGVPLQLSVELQD